MILNFNILRRLLLTVHLWVGVGVGVLLAVLGLSGAALVFTEELEGAVAPALHRAARPDAAPAPLERVLAAVTQAQGRPPRVLDLPRAPGETLTAWMDAHAGHRVYVDPASARVLGERPEGTGLLGWLRSLHISLLAGERGEGVVGAGGVALLVLALSGAVLAWPGARKLHLALTVRRPLRGRRAHFDLHRTGGALFLLPLLLTALTGTALVFPEPFRLALDVATGAPPAPVPPLVPAGGAQRPSLDALVAAADAALPGGQVTRVNLPAREGQPLTVRKRLPGELHPVGTSHVLLAPGTGAVLRAVDARAAHTSARLMALRYPLHIGAVGGPGVRVLTALAGLLPAGLFVTGLFLWRLRLTATRSAERARRLPSPT